jgi:hypothetical protein
MAMKIKNSLTLLMVVFLLLTSTGISVFKMKCLMSGKQKFSFIEAKKCCPADEENKGDFQLSSQCCEYTSGYFHFDYNNFQAASSQISLIAPLIFIVKSALPTFDLLSFPIFYSGFSPPKYSGKALLAIISVFRI